MTPQLHQDGRLFTPPGAHYPLELFHDGNHTSMVVFGPEEHTKRRAEGWVQKRTEGATYVVHTACPPLAKELMIPPIDSPDCANCQKLTEQFEAAWEKQIGLYRELQMKHQGLVDSLTQFAVVEPHKLVVEPEAAPAISGDPSPAILESAVAVPEGAVSNKLTPPLKKHSGKKAQ